MGPKPACFGAFSTTPNYQAPMVTQMPKIYLFWRISAGPIKMYILENLNQISEKLKICTKTQKMYIFWRKYVLSPRKKNMCFISKIMSIIEKIGDLTMKANFI